MFAFMHLHYINQISVNTPALGIDAASFFFFKIEKQY